jgi:hypothetical protein
VLTSPQPRFRRGRPPRSLRQEYGEFILERIEEFKQQISRTELMRIADDAVRELDAGAEEQLVLTEVLVLEHVDRLIIRRLNLPTYRRWRTRHIRLRRAQQEPTHWGIDPRSPLVSLVSGLELDGEALAVGTGAQAVCLYLAAHDWPVVFIGPQVAQVEALETRAAAEALGTRIQAYVVSLGTWFPEVSPALAVLDPGTLAGLDAPDREQFFRELMERTPSGGVHHLLTSDTAQGVITFAPEIVKSHYAGWRFERIHDHASRGFIATKP